MQRVGFDAEAAVGRGRDLEFLVTVAERFDALAEVLALLHRRAQRGAGAVGAEQRGEGVFGALRRGVVDERGAQRVEVDRVEALIEMQARAGALRRHRAASC